MRSKIFLFFILLITVFALTFSQTQPRKSIKEKLDKLKGEISKIVIQTDEGEVTLENDEAEDVFEKLNNFYGGKGWTYEFNSDDDDKVFVVKMDEDGDDVSWIQDDSTKVMIKHNATLRKIEGVEKTVEIEVENGDKKVTVTTVDEDGNETTQVYEGEEAEKYLDEHGEKEDVYMLKLDDKGSDKKKVKVIIEKMKEEKK